VRVDEPPEAHWAWSPRRLDTRPLGRTSISMLRAIRGHNSRAFWLAESPKVAEQLIEKADQPHA